MPSRLQTQRLTGDGIYGRGNMADTDGRDAGAQRGDLFQVLLLTLGTLRFWAYC